MSSTQSLQVQLPPAIPLQRGDETWVSGRSATSMLVLFALLIAVWMAVRKTRTLVPHMRVRCMSTGARRGGVPLRVVASQRLSSYSVLHVVDYEGRRLLIADSAQGVQCIIDEPRTGASTYAGGSDHVA